MSRIRTGLSDNADDFVRRYRETVFRIALSILGRTDVAEDVTQETLLRALKHRSSIQEPLLWLRVATVRRALSALAKMPRERAESDWSNDRDSTEDLAVRQTLARLPVEQQTLLALSIGQGWTYEEIAAALEIPAGTVASRIHAAKEAFRRRWEDQ